MLMMSSECKNSPEISRHVIGIETIEIRISE